MSAGVLKATGASEGQAPADRALSSNGASTSGGASWGEDLQVCLRSSRLVDRCVGTDARRASLQSLLCRQGLHPLVDVSCSVMVLHAAAQVTWRSRQKGVVRYNCADSLDRTNAASYFAAVQVRPFMLPACALWCSSRPEKVVSQDTETPNVTEAGNKGGITRNKGSCLLALINLQWQRCS